MSLLNTDDVERWLGYQRAADVERWLVDNRVTFWRGRGGEPITTQREIDRCMDRKAGRIEDSAEIF